MNRYITKYHFDLNIGNKILFSFLSDDIYKILFVEKKHIKDESYEITIHCIVNKYEKYEGAERKRYAIEGVFTTEMFELKDDAQCIKHLNGVYIFFYEIYRKSKIPAYSETKKDGTINE